MYRLIRRALLPCLLAASLPFAQAAMTTPGQFGVSASGAATYTIPIQVPPGTAGIEPKLALSYNSQGGNGLLGMGWSLSGLSAISRCPRTMAQDGVRGAVNYDNNDRYCLDGQRLIAIQGADGADGTEYRTELDSFAKIMSYGSAGNGPAWFKVWTKSGQVMEYGNTGDARIEAQGKATVRVWALNRLQDTKGNYLTVSYTEDNANGDFYPQRIDYAGNDSTAITPNNSVQFAYTARLDITPQYIAGSLFKNTQRLTAVRDYSGSTLVREYRLRYEYGAATLRSRVDSIAECDGNSICLPALALTWQGNVTSFSNSVASGALSNSSLIGWKHLLGDFNGDGKIDMTAVYVGASGLQAQTSIGNGDGTFQMAISSGSLSGSDLTGWTPMVGDFNGDGKLDIAAVYVGSSGLMAQIALGNGNGSFQAAVPTGSLSGSDLYGWKPLVADFDGDGRTDLAAVSVGRSGFFAQIAIAQGGTTFQSAQANAPVPASNLEGYVVQLGDFNGDGRADMAAIYAGSSGLAVQVAISTGGGVLQTAIGNVSLTGSVLSGYTPITGDFNGDGKSDVAAVYIGVSGMTAQVALGSGNGTFLPAVSNGLFSTSLLSGYTLQPGDFNGDGKLDLVAVYIGDSGLSMVFGLGKGDGMFDTAQATGGLSGSSLSSYVANVGDINGDGKPDVMAAYVGSSGMNVQSTLVSTPWPDLLVMISPATGSAVRVAYKAISDIDIYYKDATASYPLMDLQMPLYVVSSVSSSNGIGGTVTTNYRYGGLKAELGTGRGLLGFRWIDATQVDTGITTHTEYRQDFPYTGLPSLVKKTLPGTGNSGLLSQASTSYGCLNPADGSACVVGAGKRYFPYASQSTEASWDLNGAALPTISTASDYDLWGNPVQITVSSSDGYGKSTINSYTNDAANWLLGRLTKAIVTSTTP
jgi:hypothetical protein